MMQCTCDPNTRIKYKMGYCLYYKTKYSSDTRLLTGKIQLSSCPWLYIITNIYNIPAYYFRFIAKSSHRYLIIIIIIRSWHAQIYSGKVDAEFAWRVLHNIFRVYDFFCRMWIQRNLDKSKFKRNEICLT